METDDKNYKKDEDERVKTFLKIKTCETVDKQYYTISDNKQILSLFDPIVKSETSKTIKFEIDKIFTDKNENSYIYEEIARDCVSDSLKGEDFIDVRRDHEQIVQSGYAVNCGFCSDDDSGTVFILGIVLFSV